MPATVGSDVHTQNALAGFFLRVFAWQIPLYGIGVVLSSILQAKSKFFWPAIAPILSSVVVITAFVLYGQLGGQTGNLSLGMGLELGPNAALQVLSWGTTLGVVALTLPLLIPVRKLGIKFYPCLRLPAGRGKQALGLAGASIVALCAQQLWVITNLGLARSGGELGTVAVFQYTQAVFYLPYAVLAVPVITAVFPRLSAQAEEPGLGKFAAQAGQANRLVASVSIYGGAALVAVAPAIAACFQVLTPVHGMNGALVALAPGVFGLAMMQLNTKALYALKMGRLAAVATTIGWVSACGLALLLVRLWAPHGANGPATLLALGWAHSGGVLIGAAGLLLALRRKVGPAITQSLGQVISVTTVCMLGVGLAGNQLCALLLRWWGPGIWNGLGAGLVVFAVVTAVFTVIWYGFLAKKTAPVFAN